MKNSASGSVATALSSVPKEVIAAFDGIQSGVVCDALGRLGLSGWMMGIRPANPNTRMVGRARTLLFGPKRGTAPSDLNMYAVIRNCAPGDILVMATGSCPGWIYGENVAHTALYQGLGGIVTDAAARDGRELMAVSIPCYSRGFETRPPHEIEIVARDCRIDCGGAQVHPGDVLVGDADGVVVVPWQRASHVLQEVEDLNMLESLQEAAIARRAPLEDIYEILRRKKLRKTGPES